LDTKKGVKKLRKTIRDEKGINTILASLLMVVIVVVASVMVYAWSTGLLGGLLVTPNTGKEALNMESATFNSLTNVTIYIRNTGSAQVAFTTYYVKDSSGNTYTQTAWSSPTSPTIAPNVVGIANIPIGGSCSPACTLSGAAFTYTAGSYTVTVVTTRNSQFVFNVVK
jgi:FlaG/FlaF family flagellin (archaellin)